MRRLWFALLLAGCGGEGPPLEVLELRDALGADPEVIAAMAVEARRDLAQRMLEADQAPVASEGAPVLPEAQALAKVHAVDAVRKAAGKDSIVVARCQPSAEGGLAVQRVPALDQPGTAALPRLEGAPAMATAEVERRALEGAAGRRLRETLQASGAERLVRVVGWPSGAIAVDGAVYVNASWLVALEALEPQVLLVPVDAPAPVEVPAPVPARASTLRPTQLFPGDDEGGPGRYQGVGGGPSCDCDPCDSCTCTAGGACPTCSFTSNDCQDMCNSACSSVCSSCETAGRTRRPAHGPGFVVWLLLPLAYIWWNGRRGGP